MLYLCAKIIKNNNIVSKIKLKDRYFVPYINANEIDVAVSKVTDELNEHYKDSECPLFVSVLTGAYMFTADVLRKINFTSDITFIKISSYNGIDQSGEVKVILGVNQPIINRDIIILDEIVDSGTTIDFLKNEYTKMGALSVKVATLIYKPNSLKKNIKVDFWGIEMHDNEFVVGYGLDYEEKGRTLKDIYILDNNNEN